MLFEVKALNKMYIFFLIWMFSSKKKNSNMWVKSNYSVLFHSMCDFWSVWASYYLSASLANFGKE